MHARQPRGFGLRRPRCFAAAQYPYAVRLRHALALLYRFPSKRLQAYETTQG
jgi:hypothetical protein